MKALFPTLAFCLGLCLFQTALADSLVGRSLISTASGQGKRLYDRLCSKCHGVNGHPPEEVKELLRPSPKDLSKIENEPGETLEDYIKSRIFRGKSNNRLHYEGTLSDEQLDALATFIKSLATEQIPPNAQAP